MCVLVMYLYLVSVENLLGVCDIDFFSLVDRGGSLLHEEVDLLVPSRDIAIGTLTFSAIGSSPLQRIWNM